MYDYGMLTHLAISNGGSPTGLGALFASVAATLAGLATAITAKRESWRERSRQYATLNQQVRQLDSVQIRRLIDAIYIESPRAAERLAQMEEELASNRGLPAKAVAAHVSREIDRLKERGELSDSQARQSMVQLARGRDILHRSEIESVFKHARIAFYSFLGVALATSAVLFLAAYLALSGSVAVGAVVAFSGAIPGSFTAGLYRIFRSAEKRADAAMSQLDREVQRDILLAGTRQSRELRL